MNRPIHFQFQQIGDVTVVALDSKLSDYDIQTVNVNGQLMARIPEKTIKDCRHIDGCIYLHLGRATDAEMVDLIEKFQKLKQEKGWKPEVGIMVPDPKFNLN